MRVGPQEGATICPVATSRLRMKGRVPWRTYANSRRATVPGAGGPAGVRALQRLDAGQLVGTHDALPPGRQRRGRAVPPVHVGRRRVEPLVAGRGQPVAAAVRPEVPLSRGHAAWRGEIVGRMPRRTTSSATSRPVHWPIGRPDAPGASQARATIRQTCSAPLRVGAPLRGAAASRSSTRRSARAAGRRPSHRPRHRRAVSTVGRRQDDARPERDLLRGRVPPDAGHQPPPFLIGRRDCRRFRPAHGPLARRHRSQRAGKGRSIPQGYFSPRVLGVHPASCRPSPR